MAAPTFASLRSEYARLLATMTITSGKLATVDATAKKVLANKARYMTVQNATGVPWLLVGLIHSMEASLSFTKHLHNGDPLTARTVQVPKARPVAGKPPFTWEESAIDAVRYDGLDKVTDWCDERIAYQLEGYNGWGYRLYHSDVLSPYLWSFTSHYRAGKYAADGKWSQTLVSQQVGAMALLQRVRALDAGASPTPSVSKGTQVVVAVGATAATTAAVTWWDQITAFFAPVLTFFGA
ncbi:hypothetical protein GCM10007301_15650 [Azorhizobium oxalatiphilum]|uniref:Lysozyme family protein n=1 Tax=Azorhizobium oxalatiphilum TaxID=980631 RepID=A0A917BW28_9HYPH|nr:hypothetical protein [Azorhizobium oxalatiphilum]GGF56827.1 hypothetical protein GCM10007301_15650 [Azorhizobium oxalatiphilum]